MSQVKDLHLDGLRAAPGTWIVAAADGCAFHALTGSDLVSFTHVGPDEVGSVADELVRRELLVPSDAPGDGDGPCEPPDHPQIVTDVTEAARRLDGTGSGVVVVIPDLALHIPADRREAGLLSLDRVLMSRSEAAQRIWTDVLGGRAHIVSAAVPRTLGPLLRSPLPDAVAVADLGDPRPAWLGQGPSALTGPARPARGCRLTEVRRFAVASALAARTRARVGLPEMVGGSIGLTADEAMPRAVGEAYERYAAGVVVADTLVAGAGTDLPHAVDPNAIISYLDWQHDAHRDLCRYDPTEPRVWTRAQTVGGEPRLVLADLVFFPFGGPGAARHTSANSSGVAAGRSPAEAQAGAWAELLERDAFMRAWCDRQRLPRLDLDEVGDLAHAPYLGDLEEDGWEVRAFALDPASARAIVVAIAVRDERMALGAAAARTGPEAMAKAMREAWSGAFLVPRDGEEVPEVTEVRTPGDHRRLYRWGRHLDEAGFLWEGDELISAHDLVAPPDAPDDAITVTWPTSISEPLHVVRAFHPDLVPITFGHGREPFGRPDLRALAERAGTPTTSPPFPHPFP